MKSWKRRIVESCIVVIIATSLLWGATQTINTLPVSDSTFLATLQAFLKGENVARFQKRYAGYTLQGGIGTTSGTLAHTISALTAFPGGYYVYKDSFSHTYAASTRTYVYADYDSARTITIAGATVTRATHVVFAEMAAGATEPLKPAYTVCLMRVDTSGVAITAIEDLRSGGTISTEAYGSFESALANAPPASKIVLAHSETLTAPRTVPAKMTYGALVGAKLTTTAVNTLTFTTGSHLEDNGGQMFSAAAGEVVLPTGNSQLHWFGEDAAAFTTAVSATPIGSTLITDPKTYSFSTGVTIDKRINLDMPDTGVISYSGTGTALTITGGQGNFYNVGVSRAVNWTAGYIGLALSHTQNCVLKINNMIGFQTGVYLHDTDGSVAYNYIYLNYIVNNQIGVSIYSNASYVNYNVFYGGRFAVGDNTVNGTDRYGVRINAAGANASVHNYFHDASFEIDNGDVTSVSVDFDLLGRAEYNSVINGRGERSNYAMQVAGDAFQNVYEGYLSTFSGTDLLLSSYLNEVAGLGAPGSNRIRWLNDHEMSHAGLKDVWPISSVRAGALVMYHSVTDVGYTVSGFGFLNESTGAFLHWSSKFSLYKNYATLQKSVALGRTTDTTDVKDFWVKHTNYPADHASRFFIVKCFDEDGAVLSGTSPYYVTGEAQSSNTVSTIASTADFGGAYRLASRYELAHLRFHADVKSAFIGIANVFGTSTVTVNSLALMCRADEPTPGSWVGEPLANAHAAVASSFQRGELRCSAAPIGGILTKGDTILELDAAAGAAPGWSIVARGTTTAADGEPEGEVALVVSDAGTAATGDVVGVLLDNDLWHWSTITVAGTTFTMANAVPVGRTISAGARVIWYRTKAMANLAA